MSQDQPAFPSVSIIIPVRPGSAPPPALAGVPSLRYPPELLEVLVVEGENPSAQRNAAMAAASGEVLYFIDDDTELDPWALARAMECLRDGCPEPDVACVGGPVLTSKGDGPFQRAVGAAMGSVFGLGPVRNRFVPYGPVRLTSEQELLSANLAMRRDAMERVGGFDEALYPNEETELLKRLRAGGLTCAYHPLMTARRSQRRSLPAIFIQNFRYGASRMAHFAPRATAQEYMLLAPMALVLLLAAGLAWPTLFTLAPLLFYAATGLGAALFTAPHMRRPALALVHLLAIFPTIHLGYGLGSAWGLARRLVGLPVRPPRLSHPPRIHQAAVTEAAMARDFKKTPLHLG
jgi:succinoglycan biosynthesis protein ExoA